MRSGLAGRTGEAALPVKSKKRGGVEKLCDISAGWESH